MNRQIGNLPQIRKIWCGLDIREHVFCSLVDYRLFGITVVKAYVGPEVDKGSGCLLLGSRPYSDHYSSMILEHPEPTNRWERVAILRARCGIASTSFVVSLARISDLRLRSVSQDPLLLLVFHPALCCSRWRPRWLAPKVRHWLTGASYPRMD